MARWIMELPKRTSPIFRPSPLGSFVALSWPWRSAAGRRSQDVEDKLKADVYIYKQQAERERLKAEATILEHNKLLKSSNEYQLSAKARIKELDDELSRMMQKMAETSATLAKNTQLWAADMAHNEELMGENHDLQKLLDAEQQAHLKKEDQYEHRCTVLNTQMSEAQKKAAASTVAMLSKEEALSHMKSSWKKTIRRVTQQTREMKKMQETIIVEKKEEAK
eukprot:gene4550-5570_t